MELAKFEN